MAMLRPHSQTSACRFLKTTTNSHMAAKEAGCEAIHVSPLPIQIRGFRTESQCTHDKFRLQLGEQRLPHFVREPQAPQSTAELVAQRLVPLHTRRHDQLPLILQTVQNSHMCDHFKTSSTYESLSLLKNISHGRGMLRKDSY